jgi:hypothetical protein
MEPVSLKKKGWLNPRTRCSLMILSWLKNTKNVHEIKLRSTYFPKLYQRWERVLFRIFRTRFPQQQQRVVKSNTRMFFDDIMRENIKIHEISLKSRPIPTSEMNLKADISEVWDDDNKILN